MKNERAFVHCFQIALKTVFYRVIAVISFSILLTSCKLTDFVDSTGYKSHVVENYQLTITTDKGDIKLTAYTNKAIEVLYSETNNHFPRLEGKEFPSFAKKENLKPVTARLIETDSTLTYQIDQFKAVFSKSDLSIQFYSNEQLLTKQKTFYNNLNFKGKNERSYKGFDFELERQEKIMGGGERVLGMDRRGHQMPLYNRAHYGYSTSSNQMNFSIPAIMSDKKYIILFDNSAKGLLDIGKTETNTLSFKAVGGRMAYIVFAGDNYPEIINHFTQVTGRQPLPPRWALGSFASRFGYKNQQEVLDTVEKYKQEDFPLDAIIIDLYWFGKDIKGHMGNLEWDKNTFPEPNKMLAALKQKNIKPILVTEPFILSSSSKWNEAVDQQMLAKDDLGKPKKFDFYFGNTGLVDVFDKKSSDWFTNIYTDLAKQGVAGVWGDLGEPEVHPDDTLHYISEQSITVRGDEIHNAYGHQWAKIVYDNQLEIQPDVRPFIMMRAGFAGSQRYGIIPWTGDVERSWNGLKPQVELNLQMGLFGMGYTHSDLGGFAGGEKFNKEMYIRWLQYGVFQPVFRPHAQDHIAPEPVFHDQQTKNILRKYVKLRYQLLPYNYNLIFENSSTGMPLMRPVFFEDETESSLIDIKDSYFWGNAFFVSPITNPNKTEHSMRLPEGTWFDFWEDTIYVGGQEISLPVSLEKLPVMVRAGSFIPMIDSINNTSEYSSKNLTVHYYADKSVSNSEYSLFEDDGENPNSLRDGAYEFLKFNAKHMNKKLDLKLSRKGNGYKGMPAERKVKLVIHNWLNDPKNISINGVDLTDAGFNKKTKILTLAINWRDQNISIIINKDE